MPVELAVSVPFRFRPVLAPVTVLLRVEMRPLVMTPVKLLEHGGEHSGSDETRSDDGDGSAESLDDHVPAVLVWQAAVL